jgi:hypothetical protein
MAMPNGGYFGRTSILPHKAIAADINRYVLVGRAKSSADLWRIHP